MSVPTYSVDIWPIPGIRSGMRRGSPRRRPSQRSGRRAQRQLARRGPDAGQRRASSRQPAPRPPGPRRRGSRPRGAAAAAVIHFRFSFIAGVLSLSVGGRAERAPAGGSSRLWDDDRVPARTFRVRAGTQPARGHGSRICYPFAAALFIWTRRPLAVEPHGSVNELPAGMRRSRWLAIVNVDWHSPDPAPANSPGELRVEGEVAVAGRGRVDHLVVVHHVVKLANEREAGGSG